MVIDLIDTLTALRANDRTATPTAAKPTMIPNKRNMIPPAIAIAPAPISIAPVPSAIVPNASIATPSATVPIAAATHATPTRAIPAAACMPYCAAIGRAPISPVTDSTSPDIAVTTAAIPLAASHMPPPISTTIAPNDSIAGIAVSRAGPNLAKATTSRPIAIAIPASTPTASPPPDDTVLAALARINIPVAHSTIAAPNATNAIDIEFSLPALILAMFFDSTTKPTPSSPIPTAMPANTPTANGPALANVLAACAITQNPLAIKSTPAPIARKALLDASIFLLVTPAAFPAFGSALATVSEAVPSAFILPANLRAILSPINASTSSGM